MNANEILNQVKTALGMEVSLEQMKLDNGTVIEADSFESGKEVFIISEDERVPMPEGEYELEDGRKLIVSEEGVIGEVQSEEAEESDDQESVEAESDEPKKEEMEYVSKEEFSELVEAVSSLAERVEAMMPKEEEMSEEPKEDKLSKAKEEDKVEMSAEKSESIKHSPEKEPEREAFKFSTNRKESTLDRVFNFLNK